MTQKRPRPWAESRPQGTRYVWRLEGQSYRTSFFDDPGEARADAMAQLGLPEMTECALRTRAYRRQIPFHLNGHRIRFTLADLCEIAEGQPRRPDQSADRTTSTSRPTTRSPRTPPRVSSSGQETWRARKAAAVKEAS